MSEEKIESKPSEERAEAVIAVADEGVCDGSGDAPEAVQAGVEGNEERTMLDVHAPHEPVHSWKDVLIHIGIIVVGLCIAVTLEQIVEYFHHRYQIAETREELKQEREKNYGNLVREALLWRMDVAVLKNNLIIFDFIQKHPGTPEEKLPGIPYWSHRKAGFSTVAWDTANSKGITTLLPAEEANTIKRQYDYFDVIRNDEDLIWPVIVTAHEYEMRDPDPTHLSSAQVQQEIEQIQHALTLEFQAGNTMRNLIESNTDYPSIPSIQEVLDIYVQMDGEREKKLQAASAITQERLKPTGLKQLRTRKQKPVFEYKIPDDMKKFVPEGK
jgi:hypothetical protein